MRFKTRWWKSSLLGLALAITSFAAHAAISSLRAVNNAQGLFMHTGNQFASGCMDDLVSTASLDGDCEGEAEGPGNTALVVRDEPSTPTAELTCYPAEAESVQELPDGTVVFLEGAGRICLSNTRKGNVLEMSWACTGQTRDGASAPCFAEGLQGFLARDADGTHFEGRGDRLILSNIGSTSPDN